MDVDIIDRDVAGSEVPSNYRQLARLHFIIMILISYQI